MTFSLSSRFHVGAAMVGLSGRNRALNFKPTKVSTITIVDEQPAEVFRYLYIQERPMRFKAAPDEDQPKASAARLLGKSSAPEADDLNEFEDESDAVEAYFVPYDPTALNERHQDGFLQTTATTDALDKSLRRMDEQAQVSIAELGVMTLGVLHYGESRDSDIVLKAPLVLLPVRLERKSARSRRE
jgi:hypothetical protein